MNYFKNKSEYLMLSDSLSIYLNHLFVQNLLIKIFDFILAKVTLLACDHFDP